MFIYGVELDLEMGNFYPTQFATVNCDRCNKLSSVFIAVISPKDSIDEYKMVTRIRHG